eukprot:CAMPEP_0181186720 /NCGR_PEP_ID=MMETSP1096-20121128/10183_1 /TAXON_ID=156174 ORGANISM="Chrysochromulina ericina, Strain CCMP281" /NCGR_SAMPLE_ID=MMETSP1096 /ASSEMBLY_ACC=CAM_ASM_000453 /LENGTH=221 /DNA_ID=CAMNT_0023275633 /DNA_START=29 /DNA_END=695 /DNA_ORIENTATION=-
MPNKENETAFTPAQWPGLPDPSNPTYANYTEGLHVGYRYYDAHKIPFTTGFPFGHGLSYTTFSYTKLNVYANRGVPYSHTVAFEVSNTGAVPGAEIPQLYLGFPLSAGEPPKVLRGFTKVFLKPGETRTVTFSVSSAETSVWSEVSHGWTPVEGLFNVSIGASSRDIRLVGTLNNTATALPLLNMPERHAGQHGHRLALGEMCLRGTLGNTATALPLVEYA